jgi:hypothetical protein
MIHSIEIFKLDFTATNRDSAFVSIAAFPTRTRKLHVMSGNTLITDGDRHLSIWSFRSPGREVELRSPQTPQVKY